MRVAMMVLTLLLSSCKLGGSTVSQHCAHLGDQCQLDGGLLGVCIASDQPTCAAPPCLTCTPQH